jgi:hypothetical protein
MSIDENIETRGTLARGFEQEFEGLMGALGEGRVR